ncbi:dual specificity phosphatase 29-like isoform 2-T2 [Chlamydotis macqueenii]
MSLKGKGTAKARHRQEKQSSCLVETATSQDRASHSVIVINPHWQLLYQTQENEKLSLIQPKFMQERSKMPHTRDSSSPTSSAGSRASYETPALSDLQRLLWFRGGSDNHVDQVWPNIYLGDAWAARSKTTLQSLNITHILNAADGPYSINTGAKYYEDLQIEYYGVEAFDDPSFDLSIFFYDAANFIGKALNTSGGFLSQLRDLDIKLNEERKGTSESAAKEFKIHPGDAVESASKEEVGFQLRLHTAAWAVGVGAGKHLATNFRGSQI